MEWVFSISWNEYQYQYELIVWHYQTAWDVSNKRYRLELAPCPAEVSWRVELVKVDRRKHAVNQSELFWMEWIDTYWYCSNVEMILSFFWSVSSNLIMIDLYISFILEIKEKTQMEIPRSRVQAGTFLNGKQSLCKYDALMESEGGCLPRTAFDSNTRRTQILWM